MGLTMKEQKVVAQLCLRETSDMIHIIFLGLMLILKRLKLELWPQSSSPTLSCSLSLYSLSSPLHLSWVFSSTHVIPIFSSSPLTLEKSCSPSSPGFMNIFLITSDHSNFLLLNSFLMFLQPLHHVLINRRALCMSSYLREGPYPPIESMCWFIYCWLHFIPNFQMPQHPYH